MTVGSRVRELRHEHHISMLALAREVGVSELTISRLERLNKHPKVATLHKIAGALDTSVSALLESEEQS